MNIKAYNKSKTLKDLNKKNMNHNEQIFPLYGFYFIFALPNILGLRKVRVKINYNQDMKRDSTT